VQELCVEVLATVTNYRYHIQTKRKVIANQRLT